MSITNIQATAVQNLQENSAGVTLIDVREVDEFAEVASPFAQNYPLSGLNVEQTIKSLGLPSNDHSTPLYFICRSGGRSMRAAEMFVAAGYNNVFNVEGGMLRWVDLGLPTKSKR